jgi:choline monooxygenase
MNEISYLLDGRLRIAPRVGGIKDFRPRDFGLFPLKVTSLGPWIFLSFNKEEDIDLATELGDLHNRLSDMNYMKLHFIKRVEYNVNCNWKVYGKNIW